MKAFIAGTAAVIVIAIAALFALDTMQSDTADSYTTQNVRLPEAQ
jgi:uncharacterized protein YxeA